MVTVTVTMTVTVKFKVKVMVKVKVNVKVKVKVMVNVQITEKVTVGIFFRLYSNLLQVNSLLNKNVFFYFLIYYRKTK